MSDADATRARLKAELAETRQRAAALDDEVADVVAASTDVATDDEHDPDGATIAFERARVGALADQARDRVAAIEAALQRLDTDRYGVCESCGRDIPAARLEALPFAATCTSCAETARAGTRTRRLS